MITIVGAGLGGLSAAISLALACPHHKLLVLESSSEIGEIGAGIQILPNASRILRSWGLEKALLQHVTFPKQVNMIGWKGNHISSMDFPSASARYGSPFWDFHRASLHQCLLDRAKELGAEVRTKARVHDLKFPEKGGCTVVLSSGEEIWSDLVIGADGINSRTREALLGYKDPPKKTGDLAYRLLLKTEEMLKDPELRGFVEDPQVNYWLGPGKHAVNYVLRGGKQFNMVLLVPDDIPEDSLSTTVEGNVVEMRALYADWDPRIPKLLALCDSVYKWRLQIRDDAMATPWSHPSGAFVMLGDAVHATLPYLASGAGMSIEDAAVLGAVMQGWPGNNTQEEPSLRERLDVYELLRKERTARVTERGNAQQYLYHIEDGEEQVIRDRMMRNEEEGEALAWRDKGLGPWLLGYQVEKDVRRGWEEIRRRKSATAEKL